MWTRQLLKENAKVAFRRNYWICVAAGAISLFLTGGIGWNTSRSTTVQNTDTMLGGHMTVQDLFAQIPFAVFVMMGFAVAIGCALAVCLSILVCNVAQVGSNRYFIENREHKTSVGQVFYGFQGGRYMNTVLVMFLKELYIFFWSLLLIIPGFVKRYSYWMVSYILAENSDLDRKRVFELSSSMMYGHRWEAFVLELSFLGWDILGALTGGILNVFYVNPYKLATYAEFYSAVKAEALQKGIATTEDFPGVIPEEKIPEEEIPFV